MMRDQELSQRENQLRDANLDINAVGWGNWRKYSLAGVHRNMVPEDDGEIHKGWLRWTCHLSQLSKL